MGRFKPLALCECLHGRFLIELDDFCDGFGDGHGGEGGAEFGVSEIGVMEGVEEESEDVGAHGFGAFGFEEFDEVVVGVGVEFDEDFADDADAWFSSRGDGKPVEVLDDVATILAVLVERCGGKGFEATRVPEFVKGVGRSWCAFVGTRAVEASHEQIAVDESLKAPVEKASAPLEPRVFFVSLCGERDDGNVWEPGFAQGFSDERDVVCSPASAAGLCDEDGGFLGVVASKFECVNDLSGGEDGGETCVVVDVFESLVDDGLIAPWKNDEVVSRLVEGFGEESEVDGAHLGGQDGVVLAHVLGERPRSWAGFACMGDVAEAFAFVEGGDKASETDTGGSDVAAFVDFEGRVDPAFCLEDFHDLVGGDGVEAAAEAVELNEFEVWLRGDEACGAIESGVISPLVDDAETFSGIAEVGDGIFGEDGNAHRGDHVGDAVVNFGIDVVRPSGQDDAARVVCAHVVEGGFGGHANVAFVTVAFGERGADGSPDFEGRGAA